MQPPAQLSLLEAARIVARGGELDAKLDALCEHALSATGASAAVVYLFDPVSQVLVPAAQAGLDSATLADQGTIAADDETELVAQVVRERRPASEQADKSSATFAGRDISGATLVAMPLVAGDETGGEDAEGVLLAVFDGQPGDGPMQEDALGALADLCAVAIRQARLENALIERADWVGRLSSTDPLTGLANRITFERMLELELARATRQQSQVSVLIFDVDGFAQINEQDGAAAGDDVLRRVASTLAGEVRVVDTVARYGADEFALIAPGGGGDIAGRRIGDAIARGEAGRGPISVSVGVAVYPADGASAQELLSAAGEALSEAKRRGRGSIVAAARS